MQELQRNLDPQLQRRDESWGKLLSGLGLLETFEETPKKIKSQSFLLVTVEPRKEMNS